MPVQPPEDQDVECNAFPLVQPPTRRRLTITTSNSYVYDPERVQALYEQLKPDPDQYADDPAYAVWAYLSESMYGADVFEDRGDFDQGYEDEEYDPDA